MIKVTRRISIRDFEGWCGAEDTLRRIWEEDKLDELDDLLESMYPEGTEIDETALNDWLWFNEDDVLELLGIQDP